MPPVKAQTHKQRTATEGPSWNGQHGDYWGLEPVLLSV